MANLAEHDALGVLAGCTFALLLAAKGSQQGDALDVLFEAMGGAVGGKLGSRLPDVLEPPTSSWHRSTAHSLVATGTVAAFVPPKTNALAEALRVHSRRSRQLADEQPTAAGRHQLARFLSRFAAGALNGLPAGYVSHTVLDSATPRSIPLITKGL